MTCGFGVLHKLSGMPQTEAASRHKAASRQAGTYEGDEPPSEQGGKPPTGDNKGDEPPSNDCGKPPSEHNEATDRLATLRAANRLQTTTAASTTIVESGKPQSTNNSGNEPPIESAASRQAKFKHSEPPRLNRKTVQVKTSL